MSRNLTDNLSTSPEAEDPFGDNHQVLEHAQSNTHLLGSNTIADTEAVDPRAMGLSTPNFQINDTYEDTPDVSSSSSDRGQYGKPYHNYNGYYSQNATSSHLLSHANSSVDSRENSTNKLNIDAYDRYPSMSGSRVVSSTSLASQFNQYSRPQSTTNSNLYGGDDDSSSNKSSNPFIPAADFSPFGGYPASSFPLHIDEKEPDDYLHNPDPVADAEYEKNRFMYDMKNLDKRSLGGLLGVIGLLIAAIVVFILLPVLTYSGVTDLRKPQVYTILTHYLYPLLSAIRTDLVDPDTPALALTRVAKDGSKWPLVFSDEFNAEGRTFYDGDDQFFTAPDIHYDATHDLEWYDPDAVSTANGTLNLRMDAFKNHNLFYRSGMVQSWNKFCFTQGILEISARLPNYGDVSGLWPGLWTMGNLARPGYLASTEGLWPYSYQSCDAGITANQSSPDGISYLPGQRLNSCTCNGADHPNPGVGRGAPEIDVIEAEVGADGNGDNVGIASQSLQLAPFDIWYIPDYDWVEIYNKSITTMNTYAGGPFQEALSATTTLNISWYEYGMYEHNFQRYGFEYLNDRNTGYLRWFVGNDPTLTVYSQALHPNGNIDWRPLSQEPMSVIMNLGISNNWAYIDWNSLNFPVTFRIDYIRVYQPGDQINVGCDPVDFPTYDYIQNHLDAYHNANLTTWNDTKYDWPKNKLTGC
jgi:beta-glucanase (GH16 family)